MSYSDNNSYEQILERVLASPELANVDKRVGSIVYNAMAPLCMELADAYAKMDILEEQTYILTATGKNLEKRVYDYGIKRIESTKAKRICEFKGYKLDSQGNPEKDIHGDKILVDIDIPLGSRFAVSNTSNVTYIYTGIEEGHKILLCEQYGTIGNTYKGILLPIATVSNLIEARITGTLQPANDTETDNELRIRTQEINNRKSFGGNIQDYIERVKAIDGTGTCKVFPAWNGGNGKVLLSVVDANYDPASTEFQKLIKKIIDPEGQEGQGVGIAPIGHWVTVTAPVKKMITVEMKVSLQEKLIVSNVKEDIKASVERYFKDTRRQFKQDTTLSVYRANIISRVMTDLAGKVLNVTNVKLNGKEEDVQMKDSDKLNQQYLPYLSGEVTIV